MTAQIKRSKGSVRFAFKESNRVLEQDTKKESLIYLHFTYGDKRLKYSVGYKACFAHWDHKKQRIKNISSFTNKDKVNEDLNLFEDKILERYNQLYLKFGDNVNNAMIKNELDIIVRKKDLVINMSEVGTTFLEVCDKYITDKGTSIMPVTERVYRQAITLLERYEDNKKVALTFEMIDMSFYNSFKAFLEKENFGLKTIGKHIKSIKTFMNYAVSEGYTTSLKYKNSSFKLGKELTTEIYLSEAELKEMHIKDLSKYPMLEHVRDVFLIGCYTGQRVSDYNNLSKDDIVTMDGVQYFKFVQEKNRKQGKVVMCPITKEIKEIMDKRYAGVPPPPIKDQYINEQIKDVGLELKFKELIKREYTKGGKLITEMVPKYKLLKSHTARRSFCTNMYLKKMPVYDIMLFSGHSTEKEFYKYIRVKDEERAQHIVSMGFFNV
jgi:integrase